MIQNIYFFIFIGGFGGLVISLLVSEKIFSLIFHVYFMIFTLRMDIIEFQCINNKKKIKPTITKIQQNYQNLQKNRKNPQKLSLKIQLITKKVKTVNKKMKPTTVTTPALQQIYNQRNQYQNHKKKLMKIYQDRKSHLGYDSHRVSNFQQIREFKTKSFMHKFNQQNSIIAKQNQRMFGKLQNVKPSLRHSTSEERHRNSYSFIKPSIKSRLLQTEKQNMRISNRMRNMSSSLNQKIFAKDYQKSQKIKNRLMKYSADQSKVYLKSERYFGQNQDNKSILSYTKDKANKQHGLSQHHKSTTKSNYRKSAISHYKKQDILKNKVDTTTSNLAGIKAIQSKNRPNTSIQLQQMNGEQECQFFTTQPNKRNKIGKKKIYLA